MYIVLTIHKYGFPGLTFFAICSGTNLSAIQLDNAHLFNIQLHFEVSQAASKFAPWSLDKGVSMTIIPTSATWYFMKEANCMVNLIMFLAVEAKVSAIYVSLLVKSRMAELAVSSLKLESSKESPASAQAKRVASAVYFSTMSFIIKKLPSDLNNCSAKTKT
jgi:hypothetical protein